MCRGREDGKQGRLAKSEVLKEAVSDDGGGGLVSCELCSSRALLYCQADDAFLCQKCDRWVHGANFLAFRHIRCLLCSTCQNLTQRYLIGSSHEVALPTMISWTERSWCNSSDESKCPRTLKMPFLFL
ncbi:B-box domain protein 30 [Vitis vinifera]|nr:B-box domain protein 30 [Vitis vinifera]|eukprot:XP_010657357.1 PREDICTED: B-box domain protein 30 [Vitis vinifera]